MKKVISIAIAIGLLVQGIAIHTEGGNAQPNPSKPPQEIHKTIEAFKEFYKNKKQQIENRAVIIGDVLGSVPAYLSYRHGTPLIGRNYGEGAIGFILLGATLGKLFADKDIHEKINSILEKRTIFSSLWKLSLEQRILFEAAYQHNIAMMKLLIDYQPNFVDQIGVWKALTELYFNKKPTPGRIQRLKVEISKASPPQFRQIDPWLLQLIRRMEANMNYLRDKIIQKGKRQLYAPKVLK